MYFLSCNCQWQLHKYSSLRSKEFTSLSVRVCATFSTLVEEIMHRQVKYSEPLTTTRISDNCGVCVCQTIFSWILQFPICLSAAYFFILLKLLAVKRRRLCSFQPLRGQDDIFHLFTSGISFILLCIVM